MGLEYDSKSKEDLIKELIETKAQVHEYQTLEYERKIVDDRVFRQTAVFEGINKMFFKSLNCETEKELALSCVSVAEELTESELGFIGLLNESGLFDVIAMNKAGREACKIPQEDAQNLLSDMKIRGIDRSVIKEGKSRIINELGTHPDQTGTPEGHPAISCFLGVPIKDKGKTIGLMALANKEGGYDVVDQENIETLSAAFVEVLKRKQTEEALRESEERFRYLSESSPIGVFETDKNGSVLYLNNKWLAITGMSLQNALGFGWAEALHPEDRPRILADWAKCLEEKIGYDGEIRFVRPSGEVRWVRTRTSPVISLAGDVISHVGVNEDITERKHIEAQLQQAKKMEAIATLAGGIAHQFNNALSPISVNLDLLGMDYQDNGNLIRYIESMKNSVHKMAQLTSQLLAYARGGKYQAKIVSPIDFVRETLPLIRHTIHSDIDVNTELPSDTLPIKADITQMQMVLTAVMQNAAEAIDGKGLIKVSLRVEVIGDASDNNHPGLKPGSYICIAIEDDGKGMNEEARGRIFEPFFSTKFQGRGLGMAAAYGVVKNHDGLISVESEIERGTVVRIYLPAAEVEVKELKKQKVATSKSTGTILVIEDEEMVMDVSKSLLERLGYRVLEAKTGKEAIKIAKTFDGDIDLAILDIVLPDMNGKEIYPLIMDARPNLKVLVCSGYSIEGPAQEILNAGAEDFIQKPFNVSGLSEKLIKVMKGK